MSRRAAAALLVGAACACSGSPTFTVRRGAAVSPPPAPAAPPPAARVLHLGDFGDATRQQRAVADAIAAAQRRAPFDLGFADGDLVYPCGPDARLPGAAACAFAPDGNTVAPGFAPPADPSFAVHDRPLAFLGATPVHAVLGNHDVANGGACGPRDDAIARTKACLEVAHRGPQWVMPARHYVVDRGPARFIVVDSNLAFRDYGGFTLDDEVAFVAAQAEHCGRAQGQPDEAAPAHQWAPNAERGSAAGTDLERAGVRGAQPLRAPRQDDDRLCFLVGHHPPATAGGHVADATPVYLGRMQRLLDGGGGRIRAWLAGHDHDLQHLRTPSGLDVLVSGNGSEGRPGERFETASAGAALLFASVRWGYGILEAWPGGWRYRFEDERSRPLYCCTAAAGGPCEPTACP